MHKIIVLDNKFAKFITDDPSIFKSLRTFLSFRIAGVEYTAAYQNGWSGITYLLDKKGIFYLGLLPKVKDFLFDRNISFEEEDLRKEIVAEKPIDLGPKLKELGMIPRDYQEKIVETALKNNRGVIRAATSSGKSLCMALIAAKINKPTIIHVIGIDLLKQFHNLFSKLFDEPIGFIGNGVCDIRRINIASIWTTGRALKIKKENIISDDDYDSTEKEASESDAEKIRKLLLETKVHCFDESHVVVTDTITEIYKNINPEYLFGFSGTPYREDNTDLLINGILGEKIIDVSASELIAKGVVAQPIIKFVPVPSLGVSGPYKTIYKEYVTENEIRNNLIVKNTKELVDKNYTVLVLFKHIRHGEILFEKMKEENLSCEILNGQDSLDRRTEIKEKIENKEIKILLASSILDIGFDCPILSALVLGGSGKSQIRTLQRVGRVIRSFPGKKYAAVVDFYDQAKYLKTHSKKRYDTYTSEEGFKVIKCNQMKW